MRIAIVDFDVHHGNGTEEIVRNLMPTVEKGVINLPFVKGELSTLHYRPWLDESDCDNVLFTSTHGFGPRDLAMGTARSGWFYPASGESGLSDKINPDSDLQVSQWRASGERSEPRAKRATSEASHERSEPRAKRATSEASHERSEPRAKRATSEAT